MQIPNSELKATHLPSRDAGWPAIARFAQTFNAWVELGVEATDEICEKELERNLSDLRARLFVEQRTFNHLGVVPNEEQFARIVALLEKIRQHLSG